MYEAFYSFTGMPFQLTPDSRFFFGSQEHRKAMAFLQYGIAQQEGFVVVTGEIGAGKTTLVEHLLANLDSAKNVAIRLVTTRLDGYEMLRMLADAFNIGGDGLDKGALLGRLKDLFVGLQAQGKHPLVIVDEAQSLTVEAIEELRMLSNLTLEARAPFQGILLGQPEFRTTLSGSRLQQFRQRVIASCHLGALGPEDTRGYIVHRLTRVGWADDPHFSDAAFEQIHRCTEGVPRRINTLCSRLLLLGFLEEKHVIEDSDVASLAQELARELGPLTAFRRGVSDPSSKSNGVNGSYGANGTNGASGTYNGQGAHEEQIGQPEYDDLRMRLEQVERMADRHKRVINQALDLASKYLPPRDTN